MLKKNAQKGQIGLNSFTNLFKSKDKKNQSVMAIEISENGFAIVEVAKEDAHLIVKTCQFIQNTNVKIRADLIAELITRRDVNTNICSLILGLNDYKLLLAEAPPIPLEDLRVLMPAKVKDSLPWELQDGTNDVFKLPDDAFRGRKKSVYIASAKTNMIRERIDLLHKINIKPKVVGITELTMLGFEEMIKDKNVDSSYGLLTLTDSEGVVNMMHDGTIYLTRRLHIALSDLQNKELDKRNFFDQIILEIQRSIDFYESQMGKGGVKNIYILPTSQDISSGFDYIIENISTNITKLNPYEKLKGTSEISTKDKAYCVNCLGEAIRIISDV